MKVILVVLIIISFLSFIGSFIFLSIQLIHKKVKKSTGICLIASISIFILINIVNILVNNIIKTSDFVVEQNINTNANISHQLNELENNNAEIPITETPSKKMAEQQIDYQWYKKGKTYVRADGEKSITFDWHDEDYVRFIFNDGFVITETELYVDDQIESGLLYEVVKAGTIKIIYYYSEDKIEVIDSDLNNDAHSGIYYPSDNSNNEPESKLNYQWYQSGEKYTGGEDEDVTLSINYFSDGYFQFTLNGSYIMGTSFLSDTSKPHTIYYNVSDNIQIYYYYDEDKIEVINTENEDDYICGFYYPDEVGNTTESSEIQNNNEINYSWYYDEPLFVREDGAHTFSMGWLDNNIYQFDFDGGYTVGTTNKVDCKSIPNALLYQDEQKSGSLEVIYYYKENKIKVIDNTDGEENLSGNYNVYTSVTAELNPNSSGNNTDNSINYEWYFSNKEYEREDKTYTFSLKYTETGYLHFIFNGEPIVATHSVNDKIISGGLLYEGISDYGKMYVIYYYKSNTVQVIDSMGDSINYNGFYYLDK